MQYDELIHTEDYYEFKKLLDAENLSTAKRVKAIKDRWDYLYEKYKPSKETVVCVDIKHRTGYASSKKTTARK